MTDPVDNPFSASPTSPASPEDLLLTIKNEQGEPKYKTIEDALKALANSQAFIPKLLDEKRTVEDELKQLREKAGKIDNIEEVLKKLTANTDTAIEKTPPASGLDADAVAKLVKDQLEALNQQGAAKRNIDEVQNALKQKFGEKVKEAVAAKAASLGTTPEKLGELAATSPAMVLALFDSQKSSVSPTPAGSVKLPSVPKPLAVERPAKSVLLGATSREQKEHMLEHKRAIYQKYGIET
jgi:hypothetical protein